MGKQLTLFLIVFTLLGCAVAHSLVPLPKSFTYGTSELHLERSNFNVVFLNKADSSYVRNAWDRYRKIIFPSDASAAASSNTYVRKLTLFCSEFPPLQLGVDESYSLNISESGILIDAISVYGVLRGLETLSQLVTIKLNLDYTVGDFLIEDTPIVIFDEPKFQWRGLLVDSARHYLDVDTIKRVIDGLAYNKMNTLHWHSVDAQSFPMPSSTYPKLQDGAYGPLATFSFDDINDIIQYGYDRAVRVIPEFDVPGHAAAWGVGYPNITTTCDGYSANINNIPLNPTIPFTFNVSKGFLCEMSGIFLDQYIHLGGDEVVYDCWYNNSQVVDYMNTHGMTAVDLFHYYLDEMYPYFINKCKKDIVVWGDVYKSGYNSSLDIIYQSWRDVAEVATIANDHHRVLSSGGWYLARQGCEYIQTYLWQDTFKAMYTVDPLEGVTAGNEQYVLGGEACMWGEQVDPTVIDSRVWPRASAVAEKLWYYTPGVDINDVLNRLIAHSCRLKRRGINASPLRPDFCPIPVDSGSHQQNVPTLDIFAISSIIIDVIALILIVLGMILCTILAIVSIVLFKKSGAGLSMFGKIFQSKKTEEESKLINK